MKIIEIYNKKEKLYDVKDLNDILPFLCKEEIVRRSSKNSNKPKRYMEEFITFDIETTTFIPDSYRLDPVNAEERPYGFMYTWQLCIGEYVIFGRTWEECVECFWKIKKYFNLGARAKMVVYIHFLSYEFQFLQSFFKMSNVFAKDRRKPVTAIMDNSFELRCSWYLSNMSLEKFCENSLKCIHPKMSGKDFDYSVFRTPFTSLSNDEYGYCFCDVKGLHECIEEKLEKEGDTLISIPLTSTGYVRRDFRKAMNSNPKNYYLFQQLKLDVAQYILLKDIFRGGDTHASRFYSGYLCRNGESYDRKSAYPYDMLTKYFPMSPFMKWDYLDHSKEEFFNLCENFCVIFRAHFGHLKLKKDIPDPYMDIAHLEHYSKVLGDNGRVLAAEYAEIALTELDFEIIYEQYKYVEFEVTECYYCNRGKLPQEYRDTLWSYFVKKTELDGVEGKEYEYNKAKRDLNAGFGMLVADIIHDEFTYQNGSWEAERVKLDVKNKSLQKKLDDYYSNYNSFLSYQWGVYVTAHARHELWKLRKVVGKNAIYWDTDSLKFFPTPEAIDFFENYNKKIRESGLYAVKKDGSKAYIGCFEKEKPFKEFKTLGAKKYATLYEDGKFSVTVAGMSKKDGANEIERLAKEEGFSVMDIFTIGQTFKNVGRTISFYDDNIIPRTLNFGDGDFISGANIGVVDTTYTLGVTNEYYEIIFLEKYGIEVL